MKKEIIVRDSIHVLVAGKFPGQKHWEKFEKSAKTGKPISSDWWATSKIRAGNRILFYIVGRGVVGSGIVRVDAKQFDNDDEDNRWHLNLENVDDLKMFAPPIARKNLEKNFGEWRWIRRPQRAAQIRTDFAEKVWDSCHLPLRERKVT